MKRTVSAILLAILLTSMLYSAFKIMPAEAAGIIYIRADGSIDPPTAPIFRDGDTYTFTDNVSNGAIVVERDNVVVDGAGYTIHQSHEMNGLDVSGRRNVTIRNICVEMFDVGIYLFDSNNCSITGCIVGNNTANVWLEQSSNNTLSENTVKYAGVHGIVLRTSSENNTIAQNQLQTNPTGIMLWRSSRYNSVFANHVNGSDTAGIYMCNSSRSDIFDNNVSNSDNGLRLDTYSYENKIHGNTIEHSTHWGIYIGSSSNNTFYQNNLLDNPSQVVGDSSVNLWDNGSQGNYWSDYNGTDANHDGIGDTAYAINANNSDRYPLMEPYVVPWDSHDIGVTYIGNVWEIYFPPIIPLKTVVGLGFRLYINVFVMNYGAYSEVFNVTVYANTTAIDTITNITLASRNSVILNFTWYTSGFAKGNYTISAYASPVPDETDTADNTLIDGWVFVAMPGDVNADGIVDIFDCVIVALAFGSTHSDPIPPWNPNADINNDGIVDIFDIVVVALHFW